MVNAFAAVTAFAFTLPYWAKVTEVNRPETRIAVSLQWDMMSWWDLLGFDGKPDAAAKLSAVFPAWSDDFFTA